MQQSKRKTDSKDTVGQFNTSLLDKSINIEIYV